MGKTGMGKSTLLKNLIVQDLYRGHGLAVIDPHGDLIAEVLTHIPKSRTHEVILFNPSDFSHPMGFNVFSPVAPDRRPLLASQTTSVFTALWQQFWGPRSDHYLRNVTLSLLDVPGSTLLWIPRLLTDKTFRHQYIMPHLTNPVVKNFWRTEFEETPASLLRESIMPLLNKAGAFLSTFPLRNILGQVKGSLDTEFIMNERRILLCNLAKGAIGEDAAKLLGSLIITKLFLTALARTGEPEAERKDFFVFIDELQTFQTPILQSALSEGRKYHLNLTLAAQFLDKLDDELTAAILGNVGTLMTFTLGSLDAKTLSLEFLPELGMQDLERLDRFEIAIKLGMNHTQTIPFRARTLPPSEHTEHDQHPETVIRVSRQRYAAKREIVEEKINRWFASPSSVVEITLPEPPDDDVDLRVA